MKPTKQRGTKNQCKYYEKRSYSDELPVTLTCSVSASKSLTHVVNILCGRQLLTDKFLFASIDFPIIIKEKTLEEFSFFSSDSSVLYDFDSKSIVKGFNEIVIHLDRRAQECNSRGSLCFFRGVMINLVIKGSLRAIVNGTSLTILPPGFGHTFHPGMSYFDFCIRNSSATILVLDAEGDLISNNPISPMIIERIRTLMDGRAESGRLFLFLQDGRVDISKIMQSQHKNSTSIPKISSTNIGNTTNNNKPTNSISSFHLNQFNTASLSHEKNFDAISDCPSDSESDNDSEMDICTSANLHNRLSSSSTALINLPSNFHGNTNNNHKLSAAHFQHSATPIKPPQEIEFDEDGVAFIKGVSPFSPGPTSRLKPFYTVSQAACNNSDIESVSSPSHLHQTSIVYAPSSSSPRHSGMYRITNPRCSNGMLAKSDRGSFAATVVPHDMINDGVILSGSMIEKLNQNTKGSSNPENWKSAPITMHDSRLSFGSSIDASTRYMKQMDIGDVRLSEKSMCNSGSSSFYAATNKGGDSSNDKNNDSSLDNFDTTGNSQSPHEEPLQVINEIVRKKLFEAGVVDNNKKQKVGETKLERFYFDDDEEEDISNIINGFNDDTVRVSSSKLFSHPPHLELFNNSNSSFDRAIVNNLEISDEKSCKKAQEKSKICSNGKHEIDSTRDQIYSQEADPTMRFLLDSSIHKIENASETLFTAENSTSIDNRLQILVAKNNSNPHLSTSSPLFSIQVGQIEADHQAIISPSKSRGVAKRFEVHPVWKIDGDLSRTKDHSALQTSNSSSRSNHQFSSLNNSGDFNIDQNSTSVTELLVSKPIKVSTKILGAPTISSLNRRKIVDGVEFDVSSSSSSSPSSGSSKVSASRPSNSTCRTATTFNNSGGVDNAVIGGVLFPVLPLQRKVPLIQISEVNDHASNNSSDLGINNGNLTFRSAARSRFVDKLKTEAEKLRSNGVLSSNFKSIQGDDLNDTDFFVDFSSGSPILGRELLTRLKHIIQFPILRSNIIFVSHLYAAQAAIISLNESYIDKQDEERALDVITRSYRCIAPMLHPKTRGMLPSDCQSDDEPSEDATLSPFQSYERKKQEEAVSTSWWTSILSSLIGVSSSNVTDSAGMKRDVQTKRSIALCKASGVKRLNETLTKTIFCDPLSLAVYDQIFISQRILDEFSVRMRGFLGVNTGPTGVVFAGPNENSVSRVGRNSSGVKYRNRRRDLNDPLVFPRGKLMSIRDSSGIIKSSKVVFSSYKGTMISNSGCYGSISTNKPLSLSSPEGAIALTRAVTQLRGDPLSIRDKNLTLKQGIQERNNKIIGETASDEELNLNLSTSKSISDADSVNIYVHNNTTCSSSFSQRNSSRKNSTANKVTEGVLSSKSTKMDNENIMSLNDENNEEFMKKVRVAIDSNGSVSGFDAIISMRQQKKEIRKSNSSKEIPTSNLTSHGNQLSTMNCIFDNVSSTQYAQASKGEDFILPDSMYDIISTTQQQFMSPSYPTAKTTEPNQIGPLIFSLVDDDDEEIDSPNNPSPQSPSARVSMWDRLGSLSAAEHHHQAEVDAAVDVENAYCLIMDKLNSQCVASDKKSLTSTPQLVEGPMTEAEITSALLPPSDSSIPAVLSEAAAEFLAKSLHGSPNVCISHSRAASTLSLVIGGVHYLTGTSFGYKGASQSIGYLKDIKGNSHVISPRVETWAKVFGGVARRDEIVRNRLRKISSKTNKIPQSMHKNADESGGNAPNLNKSVLNSNYPKAEKSSTFTSYNQNISNGTTSIQAGAAVLSIPSSTTAPSHSINQRHAYNSAASTSIGPSHLRQSFFMRKTITSSSSALTSLTYQHLGDELSKANHHQQLSSYSSPHRRGNQSEMNNFSSPVSRAKDINDSVLKQFASESEKSSSSCVSSSSKLRRNELRHHQRKHNNQHNNSTENSSFSGGAVTSPAIGPNGDSNFRFSHNHNSNFSSSLSSSHPNMNNLIGYVSNSSNNPQLNQSLNSGRGDASFSTFSKSYPNKGASQRSKNKHPNASMSVSSAVLGINNISSAHWASSNGVSHSQHNSKNASSPSTLSPNKSQYVQSLKVIPPPPSFPAPAPVYHDTLISSSSSSLSDHDVKANIAGNCLIEDSNIITIENEKSIQLPPFLSHNIGHDNTIRVEDEQEDFIDEFADVTPTFSDLPRPADGFQTRHLLMHDYLSNNNYGSGSSPDPNMPQETAQIQTSQRLIENHNLNSSPSSFFSEDVCSSSSETDSSFLLTPITGDDEDEDSKSALLTPLSSNCTVYSGIIPHVTRDLLKQQIHQRLSPLSSKVLKQRLQNSDTFFINDVGADLGIEGLYASINSPQNASKYHLNAQSNISSNTHTRLTHSINKSLAADKSQQQYMSSAATVETALASLHINSTFPMNDGSKSVGSASLTVQQNNSLKITDEYVDDGLENDTINEYQVFNNDFNAKTDENGNWSDIDEEDFADEISSSIAVGCVEYSACHGFDSAASPDTNILASTAVAVSSAQFQGTAQQLNMKNRTSSSKECNNKTDSKTNLISSSHFTFNQDAENGDVGRFYGGGSTVLAAALSAPLCIGRTTDGFPRGFVHLYYPNGREAVVGCLRNGLMEGVCLIFLPCPHILIGKIFARRGRVLRFSSKLGLSDVQAFFGDPFSKDGEPKYPLHVLHWRSGWQDDNDFA